MAIRQLNEEEKQRIDNILFYGTGSVESLISSEKLHQFVLNYNWDAGNESMQWVIRNPLCDKGTALLVYWHAISSTLYQYTLREDVPDWLISSYDLVTEIEEKYLSGFYKLSNLKFDPRNDDQWDNVAEITAKELKRPIPIEMMAASPGEEPERETLG